MIIASPTLLLLKLGDYYYPYNTKYDNLIYIREIGKTVMCREGESVYGKGVLDFNDRGYYKTNITCPICKQLYNQK